MRASGIIASCVLVTYLAAPAGAAKERAPRGGSSCGAPLAYQVLLDRAGFSPGEIDGRLGGNTARALGSYQERAGVPATGKPDCATWQTLNNNESRDVTTNYGLHGTPDPSRVGYGQSHGCVRLTNWDAARVAELVGPSTPVVIK